jgi:hypothetical protein
VVRYLAKLSLLHVCMCQSASFGFVGVIVSILTVNRCCANSLFWHSSSNIKSSNDLELQLVGSSELRFGANSFKTQPLFKLSDPMTQIVSTYSLPRIQRA